MQSNEICRCCLAQGLHKDLFSAYTLFDKKEIYSDMLNDCFNIAIVDSPQSPSGICDVCISNLRMSISFKQTVLESEQMLDKKYSQIEDTKLFMKVESIQDQDAVDDDSDDYFLADAVKAAENDIKTEVPEIIKEKSSQKRSKKLVKKRNEWQAEDSRLKALLTGIGSSISISKFKGSHHAAKSSTKKTKDIKPKPQILIRDKTHTVSGLKLEKLKHKSNLQSILKFSNAMPFRHKNILGYSCSFCDKTYPDPADLRTHCDTLHQNERLNYKCNFDMQEYIVKLDVTDLNCVLCSEKFDNLTPLKDHLTKIHSKTFHGDIKDHIQQFKLKKGDIYDCVMCSATYETFKMLKQHMNVHYSNYTCSKCETSFVTRRSLNAHKLTHQEGSFKCEKCDKVFPSRMKRQYHEKTKHLGERNIGNCPYCNEPFRSYYQRNQHLVKVHNNEAKYKCNVCNKSYVLKSLLMCHIKRNHLMEKNFQCTECGYRFFSKKALKAHMVKHTGERNYHCDVCHKAYARKYTLKEHMRIHNNDRRFKCEICSMSFVQKCSLKSHLLSNHGISLAASDIASVSASDKV